MVRRLLVVISIVALLLCLLVVTGGYMVTRDIEKGQAVLAEGEEWHDDWYTITAIDRQTFAIGEPRYWQRNYNYLLIGADRALLFDTGAGIRNIRPVVESLTTLPVTVMSSHPHYDHIGNNYRFENVAWLDVEEITSEVENGIFKPGYVRGFTTRSIPPFAITEWWKPGQEIDLGERKLTLYSVPGHEKASVAMHEPGRKRAFTGDFIYPGWLVGFAPTSNLDDYLSSVRKLKEALNGDEMLYGAHSVPQHPSPALPFSALGDLEKTLVAISNKKATPTAHFPLLIHRVNNDMELYLPPF